MAFLTGYPKRSQTPSPAYYSNGSTPTLLHDPREANRLPSSTTRSCSAWDPQLWACLPACLADVEARRHEYMFALYSGSLAEPGDRNPYAGGESLVLPKLWTRGYERMMRVRIDTGPAIARYRAACAAAESRST